VTSSRVARGTLYLVWSFISSLGGFLGPIVGFSLGGAVSRRLRAIPEDDRPRGSGMARAARVIGGLTILLWFLVIAAFCGGMMLSGAGGD
jgi:hypothetical protein